MQCRRSAEQRSTRFGVSVRHHQRTPTVVGPSSNLFPKKNNKKNTHARHLDSSDAPHAFSSAPFPRVLPPPSRHLLNFPFCALGELLPMFRLIFVVNHYTVWRDQLQL